MRSVLKDDERRLIPCTTYPLSSSNRDKYAPSWPVTPVISAIFSAKVSLSSTNLA